MQKKLLVTILIFLGLIGLLARFWQFGRIPLSLYWDEVAIGLDARSLLETGKDLSGKSWLQPLFFSYGDYKAPVYIWLVTLLGRFLSVSESTVRLPSLLAFLGTAWVLFQLIKILSPKKSLLPVFTLISLLIMPWSFHFSRIGMESHLSLFWLTLTVYLTIASAKKNQPLQIIFASIATVAGIYSYVSLRFLAPALLVISFFLYHRLKFKQHLPYFLTGLAIIFAGLFILVKSPYYAASQQYRLSNDNLMNSTVYLTKPAKIRQFLVNYSAYFDPKFLFLSGDPNLRHHSGFGGELLLIQGIFLTAGLVALLNYQRTETWLVLSWLFLSPAVAALVNETPHASRAIYMMIPLAWLIGLGLTRFKPIISLALIFALSLNLLVYLHHYFTHYPSQSAQAWIMPYKQAALYFKDNPPQQPVYISNQFYRPELYFAFYLNDLNLFKPNQKFYYYLPDICPESSICVQK